MKRSRLKRKSETSVAKLRDLNDRMLTPIIKYRFPHCEACGQPTQVGHHWIEKSRSLFLRYDLERNIIPLCNSCHTKIHNLFGNSITGSLNVAEKIINNRGTEWKRQLDVDSAKTVKGDIIFFTKHHEKLLEEYKKIT